MPNPTIPKTAIITGASSGIGQELVRQLATHPNVPQIQIIATARRRERLEELAAECPPGRVTPFVADLSKPNERSDLWQFSRSRFTNLDLLVNNAGLGAYGRFEETEPAQIQSIFSVDVEAVFDLTSKAIAWMKPAATGQIVQVSSVLGEVGLPYSATYVAAKHAVNGLVKSLRPELAGSGVTVWAACPGQTESEFRQVAGQGRATQRGRFAESTEVIAGSILKAILRGHRKAFFYPSWNPWVIAQLARISPSLWDMMMVRYGRKFARDDLPESNAG